MIELIIAVAFIVSTVVYFKIKNKKSDTTLDNKSAKPIKQESQPADKVIASAESITPPAPKVSEAEQVKPVSQPVKSINKPVVAQTTHRLEKLEHKNLPQDSALRRHYLTHLHAIITANNPPRPTDSTLSRHYDTHIVAQIEQYLNNETATQQTVQYENNPKTLASDVVEELQTIIAASSPKIETAVIVPQANVSKIPEDSQLRRHYLTHLYAQVTASLPARPTDSTLRRHYDTLIENEIKNRLATQS